MNNGVVDASSSENILDEMADIHSGEQKQKYFLSAPEQCDICKSALKNEKYMTDGKVKVHSAWACMCPDCFYLYGEGIGWGIDQLYLNQNDRWLLVSGFCDSDDEDF